MIQHSAGSGKSNSISWLAHHLSNLHDKNDKVIYKRSRFIYDELPLTKYRLGQYLLPHENNEYKYEFAKWYSGEICSVEVEIQIEAINYTTRKSYLNKIKRIYSLE